MTLEEAIKICRPLTSCIRLNAWEHEAVEFLIKAAQDQEVLDKFQDSSDLTLPAEDDDDADSMPPPPRDSERPAIQVVVNRRVYGVTNRRR